MIKVIKGVIGYNDGNKITPYSAKDGNITLSPEAEECFVKKGVAVYVDEKIAPEADAEGAKVETDGEKPAYDESMKAGDLRDLGKKFGLTFKVGMSKAEMIAALDEFFAESEEPEADAEGDGEDAPTFDSTEAVH